MKKNSLLFLLFLLVQPTQAQMPDASEIMTLSRESSLVGSLSSTIVLNITEKNGSLRSRTINMSSKSYPGGVEKRFIKFIEPADVRGTSMLIVDNDKSQDEMWIYLPALKKTRRLVSSDKGKSFMSSEFTNADMSSPALADFINSHAPQSSPENQWIIESRPVDEDKADEYGFSRKVSYINTKNWQVTRMEYYNFDNVMFKVIEIKEAKPVSDGKFVISRMTAVNLLSGRGSEMKMTNIVTGAKVEDSFFTVQNLER